jgi:predicted ArsR family transcriptional regulator
MSSIDLENSAWSARSAADRLLTRLKTRGPQTAADLGAVLAITGEAVRQQLLRLASDGLVEATAEVRGVGRPSQVWRLTASGHARFPDTHAELTVQLIHTVKTVLGEEALEQLITAREQETRAVYTAALAGTVDLQERIARLSAMRNREGYMAEWRVEDDSYLLIENHCPICAAATACQGLCRAELELFREVLGAETTVSRVDHILAGARRCAYRIARRDTNAHVLADLTPKRRQAALPRKRRASQVSGHKRRDA